MMFLVRGPDIIQFNHGSSLSQGEWQRYTRTHAHAHRHKHSQTHTSKLCNGIHTHSHKVGRSLTRIHKHTRKYAHPFCKLKLNTCSHCRGQKWIAFPSKGVRPTFISCWPQSIHHILYAGKTLLPVIHYGKNDSFMPSIFSLHDHCWSLDQHEGIHIMVDLFLQTKYNRLPQMSQVTDLKDLIRTLLLNFKLRFNIFQHKPGY